MNMNWRLAIYQPGDAPAVVNLWNQTLGEPFPLRRRLFTQQTAGDPNFEPGDAAVAWAGDAAIGLILTKTFRRPFPGSERSTGSGAVSALLVRPDWRGRGVGSALLEWGEARLRASGGRRVRLGAGFYHLLPGLPTTSPEARSFFEKRGYTFTHQVHDLIGDLRQYQRPPPVTAALAQAGPGVIFGPCQPDEATPLLDFLRQTFPGYWWYWTNQRLTAGDHAQLFLMREAGRITGFAHLYTSTARLIGPPIFWSRRLGPHYGGLGPIGVAAEVRGRGLGLALLCLALEHLRHQGVHRMAIDWTDLVDFYGRVGFHPWITYWMSEVKEL